MTATRQQTGSAIRPFTAAVPEEALEDLRRRLTATRMPSRELVTDRSQVLERFLGNGRGERADGTAGLLSGCSHC